MDVPSVKKLETRETYKCAEKDIDNGNEELRADHGLPEIHRMTHLGQEGDE